MQSGASPARQPRAQHRHELRNLTYVTLSESNGGIVRNLTHSGVAVQAVAAVRPGRQMQVRFELRSPRLRVETRGEVVWSTPSGRCGIRFLDLSPRTIRQIDEWIFASLLTALPPYAGSNESFFGTKSLALVAGKEEANENDGLMVSASPVKIIELPLRSDAREPTHTHQAVENLSQASAELDWLSRPISGRSLAWTINTLAVLAALLLFALVFLSVMREPPQHPVAMVFAAAILVAAFYWGFFWIFAGGSLGARLARLRDSNADGQDEEKEARFR
jgi:PilZ domain-containing protein/RDD family protein